LLPIRSSAIEPDLLSNLPTENRIATA